MGDCVFELALGIGRYEAYRCSWGGVQGVWEGDFAGFELLFVGYKFLCS